MKKKSLIILLTLISGSIFSQKENRIKADVKKVMIDQEAAWNKGDIDGFMSSYWNSDSLKFIGKKGITYGWKNTLDNYKKSYPDKATMGKLSFTIISIEVLSSTSCYVIGKWALDREKDDVGGHFTLLWKRISGKWLIVSDHTS